MKTVLTVLSVLAVLTSAVPARAAVPAAERSILVSFYKATGGAKWTTRTGWLGKAGDECSWFGVQCDPAGKTVVGLLLNENHLSGKLPANLAKLPNLQALELEGNALGGSVPRDWGRLKNLHGLNLGLNLLSGPLPRELGNLASLESLALASNHLTGSLPTELGRLANLQVLDLSRNQLAGTLPAQLGDLRSLLFLDLSGNQLTGVVPAELGRLVRLNALSLGENQLSGLIPRALGNLAALEQLSLGSNQLTGSIPRELGRLAKLLFLDLRRNQLSGNVPLELGNATSLLGLLLASNRLGGTIPISFYNLTSIETLWLDHNRFTGPVPFELGALSTLSDRVGLDLRFNALAIDTEPGLLGDLNAKQAGGNWQTSQAAFALLEAGSALANLEDRRTGKLVVWSVPLAAGAPPLTFSTAGGRGDADLYVRFGAPPTTAQFDASSTAVGNQESVTIAAPKQGTYYVGLSARSPYAGVALQVGNPKSCFPGPATLCLAGGRFQVAATWHTDDGRTGSGHAAALTGDSGTFSFVDAARADLVVVLHDDCAVSGRIWLYAAGRSALAATLRLTDKATGTQKTYRMARGTALRPFEDSSAFAACP